MSDLPKLGILFAFGAASSLPLSACTAAVDEGLEPPDTASGKGDQGAAGHALDVRIEEWGGRTLPCARVRLYSLEGSEESLRVDGVTDHRGAVRPLSRDGIGLVEGGDRFRLELVVAEGSELRVVEQTELEIPHDMAEGERQELRSDEHFVSISFHLWWDLTWKLPRSAEIGSSYCVSATVGGEMVLPELPAIQGGGQDRNLTCEMWWRPHLRVTVGESQTQYIAQETLDLDERGHFEVEVELPPGVRFQLEPLASRMVLWEYDGEVDGLDGDLAKPSSKHELEPLASHSELLDGVHFDLGRNELAQPLCLRVWEHVTACLGSPSAAPIPTSCGLDAEGILESGCEFDHPTIERAEDYREWHANWETFWWGRWPGSLVQGIAPYLCEVAPEGADSSASQSGG